MLITISIANCFIDFFLVKIAQWTSLVFLCKICVFNKNIYLFIIIKLNLGTGMQWKGGKAGFNVDIIKSGFSKIKNSIHINVCIIINQSSTFLQKKKVNAYAHMFKDELE
jgi:hypothetical protein